MPATMVLDKYYLGITFLVSLGLQATMFAISFVLQTDKLTDLSGATNFLLLAFLTFFLGAPTTYFARNIVATVFVIIWSIRLGGFLLFRVLKMGKDSRFDEIRSKILSFAGFWAGQCVWCFVVSLPLTILNSPGISDPTQGGATSPRFGSGSDILGLIFFVVGFLTEATADAQKYRWKSSRPRPSELPTPGLWAYSRHPNFFGEMLLWWGMWLLCLYPAAGTDIGGSRKAALACSVVSPIFITLLLLFASGIPTAEKPTAERYYRLSQSTSSGESGAWDAYQEYLSRTSILLPLPPSLYAKLPPAVKTWVLWDLPMYRLTEEDKQKAREKEAQKNRDAGEV